MVAEINPVRELINVPVPVPSSVQLFATVGFEDVLQQTPRADTNAPPSLATLPPLVAVVSVIADADVVLMIGRVDVVTKLCSLP